MYAVPLMQNVPTQSPRALPLVMVAIVHVAAIFLLANGLRLVNRPSLPQTSTLIDLHETKLEPPMLIETLAPDPHALTIPTEHPLPPIIDTEPRVVADRTMVDDRALPPTRGDHSTIQSGGEGPFIGARLLHRVEPPYPPMAKRLEEQGVVVVLATIGINGRVQKVELQTSSGYTRLDQAALKSVREWTFEPARRGNQMMLQTVSVPVRFELRQ